MNFCEWKEGGLAYNLAVSMNGNRSPFPIGQIAVRNPLDRLGCGFAVIGAPALLGAADVFLPLAVVVAHLGVRAEAEVFQQGDDAVNGALDHVDRHGPGGVLSGLPVVGVQEGIDKEHFLLGGGDRAATFQEGGDGGQRAAAVELEALVGLEVFAPDEGPAASRALHLLGFVSALAQDDLAAGWTAHPAISRFGDGEDALTAGPHGVEDFIQQFFVQQAGGLARVEAADLVGAHARGPLGQAGVGHGRDYNWFI